MTTTDPLGQSGWLKDAPADFRAALLGAATTRHFGAGKTIWQAGDIGNGLIGIRRGEAGMLHALASPATPFAHIVGPGYWTGEGPLLTGRPQVMTLVARTPIDAAFVRQRDILALLAGHPEHWQQIGRLALLQARLATVIAADLMIANSRQRCAATLLRLAGCRFAGPEAGATPSIAIAQDELAGMANMTRHTIGPILHRLAADGLIRLGYRTLAIADAAALRAIAESG